MPNFLQHKASFNFSGGSKARAPTQKWAVSSLIPELVRDVQLQEMCFYRILPLPLPGTGSRWQEWLCTQPYPVISSQSPKMPKIYFDGFVLINFICFDLVQTEKKLIKTKLCFNKFCLFWFSMDSRENYQKQNFISINFICFDLVWTQEKPIKTKLCFDKVFFDLAWTQKKPKLAWVTSFFPKIETQWLKKPLFW